MDLIKIAVVDDEAIIREQIKNLIDKKTAKHSLRCQVDGYVNGEALLEAQEAYDIVFLDIQMDGLSGIETARRLRRQKNTEGASGQACVLIFITGVKEHVFEAFDVNAFHYLLKPLEEDKFTEVLLRAIGEVEKRKAQGQKPLFIKTRTRNLSLKPSAILYIESRGKKVEIHTTAEIIEMYAAMNELEQELGAQFYRCHRGYLVNMAHIAEYGSDSITLDNGEQIIMAKDKYGTFVKAYLRYLRDGGVTCV